MQNVTTYIDSKLGQELADPWGLYKGECVSLVQDWIQFNGWPMRSGNAIQFAGQSGNGWEWVANTPTGIPPAGALVVFKITTEPNGHIGIAMPGCTVSTLILANQNWPKGNDTNPVCITDFNYKNPECLGWLIYSGNVAPIMTVTVMVDGLNVRTKPNTQGAIVKKLNGGDQVPVIEIIPNGESENGDSMWYEIAPGDYISAYYTKNN